MVMMSAGMAPIEKKVSFKELAPKVSLDLNNNNTPYSEDFKTNVDKKTDLACVSTSSRTFTTAEAHKKSNSKKTSLHKQTKSSKNQSLAMDKLTYDLVNQFINYGNVTVINNVLPSNLHESILMGRRPTVMTQEETELCSQLETEQKTWTCSVKDTEWLLYSHNFKRRRARQMAKVLDSYAAEKMVSKRVSMKSQSVSFADEVIKYERERKMARQVNNNDSTGLDERAHVKDHHSTNSIDKIVKAGILKKSMYGPLPWKDSLLGELAVLAQPNWCFLKDIHPTQVDDYQEYMYNEMKKKLGFANENLHLE